MKNVFFWLPTHVRGTVTPTYIGLTSFRLERFKYDHLTIHPFFHTSLLPSIQPFTLPFSSFQTSIHLNFFHLFSRSIFSLYTFILKISFFFPSAHPLILTFLPSIFPLVLRPSVFLSFDSSFFLTIQSPNILFHACMHLPTQHPPILPYFYTSFSQSIYPFFLPSICPFVPFLLIHPSIHLSIHPLLHKFPFFLQFFLSTIYNIYPSTFHPAVFPSFFPSFYPSQHASVFSSIHQMCIHHYWLQGWLRKCSERDKANKLKLHISRSLHFSIPAD